MSAKRRLTFEIFRYNPEDPQSVPHTVMTGVLTP